MSAVSGFVFRQVSWAPADRPRYGIPGIAGKAALNSRDTTAMCGVMAWNSPIAVMTSPFCIARPALIK